jgi:hypothetical protein
MECYFAFHIMSCIFCIESNIVYPVGSPIYNQKVTVYTMDMNMNGNGGIDMGMGMVMTFGSWSDYQVYFASILPPCFDLELFMQLKLLFDFWDIQTKTQFALSWFFVVAAACAYHGLKFLISHLELKILRSSSYESILTDSNQSTPSWRKWLSRCPGKRQFLERLLHASLSATNYGLALLLMLVTMTYNPSLFLAVGLWFW